jgi:hypothetical protein
MMAYPFKQRGRAVWYVVRIICYVIAFVLGAEVGSDKLKTQRKPPSEARLDTNSVPAGMLSGWNWVPVDIFSPSNFSDGSWLSLDIHGRPIFNEQANEKVEAPK